jgi:hypothetical protein
VVRKRQRILLSGLLEPDPGNAMTALAICIREHRIGGCTEQTVAKHVLGLACEAAAWYRDHYLAQNQIGQPAVEIAGHDAGTEQRRDPSAPKGFAKNTCGADQPARLARQLFEP